MNNPKSKKRLVCTGLFILKREKIIDKESGMIYNIIINIKHRGER